MKTLTLAFVLLLPALAFADSIAVPLKSGPVKSLTIDAPPGVKIDVKNGGTFVLGGAHFEVAIVAATAADFKREHDAMMGDPAQKPAKIEADTATLLYGNRELFGEKYYEFIMLVTVGKATFFCDSSTLDDQRFTKADTDAMIKACKSLKAK